MSIINVIDRPFPKDRLVNALYVDLREYLADLGATRPDQTTSDNLCVATTQLLIQFGYPVRVPPWWPSSSQVRHMTDHLAEIGFISDLHTIILNAFKTGGYNGQELLVAATSHDCIMIAYDVP